MKIQSLRIDRLRNDAHFQFHTEFKDLVAKHGAETLKINAQFEAYMPLYDKEDEGLKKINKSAFTAEIHEADKARDEIWVGLSEMVSAAHKHFNADVREAAKRLKIVFGTYGNIAKKPLNEQTSATYNVLQELQGKYAADVETAGFTQWVAELQARNNRFGELMKGRFDETAAKSNIVLRFARVELDKAYRSIAERINALAIVEGKDAYEAFVRTLNAIVAKYVATLNRAKGRGLEQEEGH